MKICKSWGMFIGCLIISSLAWSASPYPLNQAQEKIFLNHIAEYAIDPSGANQPSELLATNPRFTPLDPTSHALLLGREQHPVWIRFTLDNRLPNSQDIVLEMDFISIDYWDVFIPTQDGEFRQFSLGDHRPYNNREINTGNYAVPFTLPSGESATYYLRAHTDGIVFIPAVLYSGDNYLDQAISRTGYYKTLAGVAIGLFLFSLMLGIQTREKIYFVYCVLVLMRILWMLNTEGSGYKYIQDFSWLIDLSSIAIISIYTAVNIVFHAMFLGFDRSHPQVKRWLIPVVGFYLFAGLVLPLFNYTLAATLVQPSLAVVNLLLLGTAIVRIWQRYPLAIIYFIALILPISVSLYSNLAGIGVFSFYESLVRLLALAFSASLILLSFALAARVNNISKEKIQAQADAMQARIEAKTKSDFLAQMSHEIRTPMNGVLGISELLAQTKLTAKQKKYNNIIHASGKMLMQLINDVLDYSKIQAGKMTVEKIAFRPREIFTQVLDSFENQLQEKKIDSSILIDDNVPKQLIGDPTRIRQILLNFISNAYKFTEKGSITVVMSRAGLTDLYTISVKDTGEGIAASAMANLFLPYYQSRASTTREHGGTGLGLSICKQLCELMGGSIGAESKEGQGSVFWFTLPLQSTNYVQDKPKEYGLDSKQSPTEHGLHILIVEDNPVNQIVAEGMVSTLGHTAQIVGDGLQALNLLKQDPNQFDLVLMDCEMPEMDGLTATKEIRKLSHCTDLPIIALTAHALGYQPQKCIEAGMDGYLAKPLKLDELRETIEKIKNAESTI